MCMERGVPCAYSIQQYGGKSSNLLNAFIFTNLCVILKVLRRQETVLGEDLEDLGSGSFPIAIFVRSLLCNHSFFFCNWSMEGRDDMVDQVPSSSKILLISKWYYIVWHYTFILNSFLKKPGPVTSKIL